MNVEPDSPRSVKILGIPLPWAVATLLAALALICAAVLQLLWSERAVERQTASTNIAHLAASVTREIARDIDVYDLSLRSVLKGLADPTVMAAPEKLRQLVLFDGAADAPGLGAILVVDEHGDVIIDSASARPPAINLATTDYFKVHAQRTDKGLDISAPLHSDIDGRLVLVLSRRIDKPDGSFGGIVAGSLQLDYLHRLFAGMSSGQSGSLGLFRADGTMIMREPYDPAQIGKVFGTPKYFQALIDRREGEDESKSLVDGVERLYRYSRVGDYPLLQSVSLSIDDLYADWWQKAVGVTTLLLACCALIVALGLFAYQELKRRMAAEVALVALSEEDKLTGLANRRRFDQVLGLEWKRAQRLGGSLSLLMIDVDRFKAYNDQFGHPTGDYALATVAQCLAKRVQKPGDLAARYGGEEFALILPFLSEAEAMRVAELVRLDVLALKIHHPGSEHRYVSVSVGVSARRPAGSDKPADLVASADHALYLSKAHGRNRATTASASVPEMADELDPA